MESNPTNPTVLVAGSSVEVGQRPDFDQFYRREYRKMVALAAATSGDRSSAEDLAQDAMLRVRRKWKSVSTYENPGAYIRRVTINVALSARRKRGVELKAAMRLGRQRAVTLDPGWDENGHVWKAVATLPGKQRAAIALHYLDDMSVRQIAEVLDCSESTAKVHLHRGRKALETFLEVTQ